MSKIFQFSRIPWYSNEIPTDYLNDLKYAKIIFKNFKIQDHPIKFSLKFKFRKKDSHFLPIKIFKLAIKNLLHILNIFDPEKVAFLCSFRI
jgi:hypothetical protein